MLESAPGEPAMIILSRSAILILALSAISNFSPLAPAQTITPPSKLSVHWEELTAADFREGIHRSQGTCVLPFGILEKHGPHLPLGTDLLDVRYAALRRGRTGIRGCVSRILFWADSGSPPRARNRRLQPRSATGITAGNYRRDGAQWLQESAHRQWPWRQRTACCPFFAQTQLDKPHDYVVYVFDKRTPQSGGPAKKTSIDMHAGESETSKMMISRPDTVHIDRATSESGADQHRQNLPEDVYTGIWWYARFPNHYSGDGSAATQRARRVPDELVD